MSEKHVRITEQALEVIHDKPHRSLQELAELTSDLENLIAGSEIAVLFLDRELRIVRFTADSERCEWGVPINSE